MSRGVEKLPFVEFVILMALMTSVLALAVDCMLPAFGQISIDLGVSVSHETQRIVSLLFLGLGFGKLFFGSLADVFGRRPIVFVGFLFFILGSIISYLSTSLVIMLLGRFLQGFGVAGPSTINMVLVRDTYVGKDMARVMSFIMSIFILVPILAPSVGLAVMIVFDWRSIFLMFIGFAIFILAWFFLRQKETLNPIYKKKFSLRELALIMWEVLKTRTSILYTVCIGLTSGAFLGYLETSQAIFEVQYKLGRKFPLYFAALALAVGVSSFLNGKFVRKFGMNFLSKWALIVSFFCSLFLFLICIPYSGLPPLWVLMSTMSVMLFCMGILFGNLSSIAMMPLGHIAGTGAAVVGSFSTIISVPLGILIGAYYNENLYSLSLGFCLCALSSLLLIFFFDHERKNWFARDF